MISRRNAFALVVLASLLSAACTLSLLRSPLPGTHVPTGTGVSTSPTSRESPTATEAAATASLPVATTAAPSSSPPTSTPRFCDDSKPLELIGRFKAAILDSDGALLASVVSPDQGMDARLFRNGRVVNYDRAHAAALFDSSFQVNWGAAPGSGLDTKGSFRELIVPDLLDVLDKDYALTCNQVQVGGTTYEAAWPYPGVDFYSLYVAGSAEYGALDWHTWLLGMAYTGAEPFLTAIAQFKWEP